MFRVDVDRVLDGVAETIKVAPVTVGGVAGHGTVFFAHQHREMPQLARFKPRDAVVGIDSFVIPDSGGVDHSMVVDCRNGGAVFFCCKTNRHGVAP